VAGVDLQDRLSAVSGMERLPLFPARRPRAKIRFSHRSGNDEGYAVRSFGGFSAFLIGAGVAAVGQRALAT
jgi:hypothetical protein